MTAPYVFFALEPYSSLLELITHHMKEDVQSKLLFSLKRIPWSTYSISNIFYIARYIGIKTLTKHQMRQSTMPLFWATKPRNVSDSYPCALVVHSQTIIYTLLENTTTQLYLGGLLVYIYIWFSAFLKIILKYM